MWSKLEYVDVWYSVPQPEAAERISSQRWHRDYNDKHLLKVFLYLVDVDESMGPFQFVAGSQPGGPYEDAWGWQPLGQNYPTEQELESRIPASAVQTFTGPAGTLLFCNTAGFHRGGFSTTKPRVLATATYSSPASLAALTVRSYTYSGAVDALDEPVALRPHLTVQSSKRADDAAPLAGERPAGRVALGRVLDLERDRLVHRDMVVQLRRVDRAYGGVDARRALVQQVARDPRGRDVVPRRRRPVPALVDVHRVERDRALRSSTLIFGNDRLAAARNTVNPISMPTGRRTSTYSHRRLVLVDDARPSGAARGRRPVPTSSDQARSSLPPCDWSAGSARRSPRLGARPARAGRRRADRAIAELGDGLHVVGDEQHRPAGVAELLHASEAAPLELGVADREHLVDEAGSPARDAPRRRTRGGRTCRSSSA